MTKANAGLAGVTVGTTAISTVGKSKRGLEYRGYSIHDLAAYSSFEEVAYLLLHEHLPNAEELQDFKNTIQHQRHLSSTLLNILESIPKEAHPMDVLRTGCSALGTLEPEQGSQDQLRIATRLLACMPSILLSWYHYHTHGERIAPHSHETSTAGFFLEQLHDETPTDLMRKNLDTSLLLYAEHEFNASTFAARITVATQSDIYSGITSAIGTLRGPLHGGANESAMALIESFDTPEAATAGILNMLQQKQTIMGFGHRVYTESDPRSDIIKKTAKQLAQGHPHNYYYEISEAIETVMRNEKNLFPNLDFYSAAAYHFCHIPRLMFTPLFVLARVTGWCAHIFEQRANNKLIRPNAEYVGPESKQYTKIDDR